MSFADLGIDADAPVDRRARWASWLRGSWLLVLVGGLLAAVVALGALVFAFWGLATLWQGITDGAQGTPVAEDEIPGRWAADEGVGLIELLRDGRVVVHDVPDFVIETEDPRWGGRINEAVDATGTWRLVVDEDSEASRGSWIELRFEGPIEGTELDAGAVRIELEALRFGAEEQRLRVELGDLDAPFRYEFVKMG